MFSLTFSFLDLKPVNLILYVKKEEIDEQMKMLEHYFQHSGDAALGMEQ